MWKAALIGALAALILIASFERVSGVSFLSLAAGSRPAPTVKSVERHNRYVAQRAPEPYRGKRNPLPTTIGNVVEGARIYDLRCAICHGMMGVGDGEAAKRLDYPPADLGRSLIDPRLDDDFYLWTISEGGAEFKTDMPPFKNDLSDREIWRVLTFVRAAFAESGDPTARDATTPP